MFAADSYVTLRLGMPDTDTHKPAKHSYRTEVG